MNANKPEILIVEDIEIAQKMAVYIFTRLNCLPTIAKTGHQALELADTKLFQLIFMDLGLPDIDGTTVAETIRRSNNLNQNTPIIALTAHSLDPILVEDCAKAGMNDFIMKPLLKTTAQLILDKFIVSKAKFDSDSSSLGFSTAC